MLKAYGQSKLASIVFAFELARRLEGRGVTSNCLHPGMVATQIGNLGGLIGLAWALMKPVLLTPAQGAETTLYLAGSPEVADTIALNRALQARLWKVSAHITGLAPAPARP